MSHVCRGATQQPPLSLTAPRPLPLCEIFVTCEGLGCLRTDGFTCREVPFGLEAIGRLENWSHERAERCDAMRCGKFLRVAASALPPKSPSDSSETPKGRVHHSSAQLSICLSGSAPQSLDHPRCACVTPFHRLWRVVFGDLRVPRSHIYRAREVSVVSPQFPGAHRRRRLRRLRALSVSSRR